MECISFSQNTLIPIVAGVVGGGDEAAGRVGARAVGTQNVRGVTL